MKSKFALCFRPVEIETEEATDHKRHATTTDHVDRKCIVVSKDQKKNRKTAAGILGSASPKFSCHSGPKIGSRKALSRILKSILFETPPGIRVGDGKIPQIKFPQRNDDPSKMKKRDSINVQQASSSSFSSTTSSSTTTSSSVSPSSESNYDETKSLKKRAFERSRSNSFDLKKKPKTIKTNDKSSRSTKEDMILYLILLALFATVIWGKLLAVLFTSLCLYGSNIGFYWRSENAGVKLPAEMEMSSKEQKKRVIMEGLLERKPIQRALNL